MTQPALFLGHGAPTVALDPDKGAPWRRLGERLARPRAILVVSAHWEAAPPTLGATTTQPLIYDFRGFPRRLYQVQYAAPGAPDLADRVEGLLGDVRRDPERGLDHGAWTPLVHLAPEADVPVLQLSLPSALGARGVLEVGRALAPLRDEGVLLIGSGNVTHHLGRMAPDGTPPDPDTVAFDRWFAEAVASGDLGTLLDYRRSAPTFRSHHPTEEHWLPVFFTLGAGGDGEVSFPVEGFEYGNLSRRAVAIG